MTDTKTKPTEARLYEGLMLREVETTNNLSMLSRIAVPYNREQDIGFFIESFEPGSLAKSIRESAAALPLLVFHDASRWPIGHAKEWQESDEALRGVWKLDRENPDAITAARQAKEGHLNFMSIRFMPIRSEWTTVEDWNPDLGAGHKDRVVRREARLIETSLVSAPAYADAKIEWVRSAERALHPEARGAELAGWRDYLERARG